MDNDVWQYMQLLEGYGQFSLESFKMFYKNRGRSGEMFQSLGTAWSDLRRFETILNELEQLDTIWEDLMQL